MRIIEITYMNLPTYDLKAPKIYRSNKEIHSHNVFFLEKKLWIVPISFSKQTINPKNFVRLKQKYNLQKILINDRIKPSNKTVCIIDHVNRSGMNFLSGNTPVDNLDVFPDMCNIYNPIKGLKKVTVHTAGPERFFDIKQKPDVFLSEYVGLISPVWHYVGVKVFAQNNFK